MKTLDEIKGYCRRDEITGCLVWTLSGFQGVPRIHAPNLTKDPSGQTLTVQSGQRAVWHIKTGKPIPAGHMVFNTCRTPGCLDPQHMRCAPRKDHGAMLAAAGVFKNVAKRIIANRKTLAARSTITPAVEAEILGSAESNLALAVRLELHKSTISKVKHGKHRDTPRTQLWAGLGARATA